MLLPVCQFLASCLLPVPVSSTPAILPRLPEVAAESHLQFLQPLQNQPHCILQRDTSLSQHPSLEIWVPVPRESFSEPPSLTNSHFFPCSPRLGGGRGFLQLLPPRYRRVFFFTFSDLVNSHTWLTTPYIMFTAWFPFLTAP